MYRKLGFFLLLSGAVLIGTALLLFFNLKEEDKSAGEYSKQMLSELKQQIIKNEEEEIQEKIVVSNPVTVDRVTEIPQDPVEPESELEPEPIYDYLGILAIPSIDIELPVISSWDYKKLKKAPCRESGSLKDNNLVIVAHNYKRHFGYLKDLKVGDQVLITDLQGETIKYEIKKSVTLNPDQVEAVERSGYDLVLYTCTYGGKTRVVVFCNRIDKD